MKKKHVLLVVLSSVAVSLAACGGNKADPATPPTSDGHDGEHKKSSGSGAVKAPGDANVGDTTKCPVSGEEMLVEANSPHTEHNGKTYYFCCSNCKKKFEANPEKFLNKS